MKDQHKTCTMKALLQTAALSSCILVLSACAEEDESRYPSAVTDYACLATNTNGKPELLYLDNGCSYPITFTDEYREAHAPLPTYKADTLYRVISTYELGADSTAQIYSMTQVLSPIPTPLRKGETLYQDPVYLQSCWLSGGYLNMVVEMKALNGKHQVGFVDTTPDTMQGKEFTFYHKVVDDVESYRQELYASIPLTPFRDELQQGDTLRLVINTYEGKQEVSFAL